MTVSEISEAECHKCDKCERCYESKWRLNRHLKSAHLKKTGRSLRVVPENFSCKICNEQTVTPYALRHHLISCHLDSFASLRYGKPYYKIVPTFHQAQTQKTMLNHLKKYMKGKRETSWYWDF
jgi:hypothetical protein